MSYIQSPIDKADEALLRRLLTERISEEDANKIITHVFSDLIKWTMEDVVIHLTEIFNFTKEECDQLLNSYNIDFLTTDTTTQPMPDNPQPNYNLSSQSAEWDLQTYQTDLWNARKLIQESKKLLSKCALFPDDYKNQDEFNVALNKRLDLNSWYVNINKYIDEHIEFAAKKLLED